MSVQFERHRALLDMALEACHRRHAWTAFPESPSSKIHGADIPAEGLKKFQSLLGQPFEIDLPGVEGKVGEEHSPFTGEALGISYPQVDVDATFAAAKMARQDWQHQSIEERVGICLEMMARLGSASELFVNAHATVHTAGQSFIMAFAGCGANALDRGLEALAYAYKAMSDIPSSADWSRRFGAAPEIHLHKRYRLMPLGTAVVVTCATFPQWNGYPAIMANLATGNAVVVKPHPRTILPVALFVRTMREVLRESGHDPNLLTLVADTRSKPATLPLINHADTRIVDFTGGPEFGRWIEQNCPHAQVYTETAGCNSVIIESVDDLDAVCDAIAHSLCQASAQMCTSVQNIFVSREGIETRQGKASFETVCDALRAAVERQLEDPKRAAFLCGALVDVGIYEAIANMEQAVAGKGHILRSSIPYAHPEYPAARTATPLMVVVDAREGALYGREHFGPISFLIACDDADHGLRRATEDVRLHGAITSHVYSSDASFLERAERAYHEAGASLSCNLLGMPINFAAAYSDFHVTGLNPAGNACLTDLAFVTGRFRIVQTRFPVRS